MHSGPRTRTKYSYDALNRVVGVAVNGVTRSVSFDAIGRVTANGNPLDTFSYTYSDATRRITGVASAQGPASAMSYYGPKGDELLQQITATTHTGAAINQFGYVYNANDNPTSFSVSAPTSQTTSYAYDKDNRVVAALGSASASYGYDNASNILSMTLGGMQESLSYTSTNAIASGAYDASGSPLSLGGNIYTWDGANRITNFANASGASSTFTYDGVGHLVRVVDQMNGITTADHSYVWCGSKRCLAHDNTQNGSPISTQYFGQGVIAGGVSYYYVRDRLGSVRELITSGGAVAVQYDYDVYGNPVTLSGSATSDIGYAGYFYHANSGLDFTLYRAYDPAHGRWLSRDPAGEVGGINLYAYANENPLLYTDPSGLVCGVDPITGELTPPAQAALDTWNEYLGKGADANAAGNYPQTAYDQAMADWARRNYYYSIGQGPFAGPPPVQDRASPPPPPQMAPAPAVDPLPVPNITINLPTE